MRFFTVSAYVIDKREFLHYYNAMSVKRTFRDYYFADKIFKQENF